MYADITLLHFHNEYFIFEHMHTPMGFWWNILRLNLEPYLRSHGETNQGQGPYGLEKKRKHEAGSQGGPAQKALAQQPHRRGWSWIRDF
jgi:hypothetical protein